MEGWGVILINFDNYLDNIEGIIFDLDGTLIDSMKIWDDIASDVLLEFNKIARDDLKSKTRTMSLKESSSYIIDEYEIDITADVFENKFKRKIFDLYENNIQIKEGALEYIKLLKERGKKLAILTASERELAEVVLKRYEILDEFEFIMTVSEEGISKSMIEIYEKASIKLDLERESILIVEDALHCINTAKRGQFKVMGVFEEYFLEDQEKIIDLSDIYIHSFLEVL